MDNTDSNKDLNSYFSNNSNVEKLGWALVIFSFIVGTWGLAGELAIIGVIMAATGGLIGLIKKNWILFVFGAIDTALLLSFMNDMAELNSIMNSF